MGITALATPSAVYPARPFRRCAALWAVLLLGAAIAPLDAQNVRGRVLDATTSEPLATTAVTLLDRDGNSVSRAIANAQGIFLLSAPEAGEYRIRAERIGFAEVTLGPVRVEADRLREVQIRLAPDAIPMDALIVASERQIGFLQRQGFYERRRAGFGRFLDRYAIEQSGSMDRTLDLFIGLPGTRIVYENDGRRGLVLRGGMARSMSSAYCPPRVVVDGVESPGFDLDLDIRPGDIEAIEIYASGPQAPARFSDLGSGCGVVVIWRRI